MKGTKVDRARLAGFVVAVLISIPLGFLLCVEVFELPIWVGLVVLLICSLVIGSLFYARVVLGKE